MNVSLSKLFLQQIQVGGGRDKIEILNYTTGISTGFIPVSL